MADIREHLSMVDIRAWRRDTPQGLPRHAPTPQACSQLARHAPSPQRGTVPVPQRHCLCATETLRLCHRKIVRLYYREMCGFYKANTRKISKVWRNRSRWLGLGRYSATIDPTGSGKPMGCLPASETFKKKVFGLLGQRCMFPPTPPRVAAPLRGGP